MYQSNVVAQEIEAHENFTFSAKEMASNIVVLCTRFYSALLKFSQSGPSGGGSVRDASDNLGV
jgi:hypothetical protein